MRVLEAPVQSKESNGSPATDGLAQAGQQIRCGAVFAISHFLDLRELHNARNRRGERRRGGCKQFSFFVKIAVFFSVLRWELSRTRWKGTGKPPRPKKIDKTSQKPDWSLFLREENGKGTELGVLNHSRQKRALTRSDVANPGGP